VIDDDELIVSRRLPFRDDDETAESWHFENEAIPTLRPSCFCPMVYRPVCGSDGRTHSNSCSAGCRGVEVESQGPCEMSQNLEVIDDDELIVSSRLPFRDDDESPGRGSWAFEGEQEPEFRPAAETGGDDDELIVSRRLPFRDDDESPGRGSWAFEGEQEPEIKPAFPYRNCICPAYYSPVCDVASGRTFGNSCGARCAGATKLVPGSCGDSQKVQFM